MLDPMPLGLQQVRTLVTESERRRSSAASVAVVAVNWNGWRDTLECMESVRHLDYPEYLMIVVDNGSRDDSLLRINEWAHSRQDYLLVQYTAATARAGGQPEQEHALELALPAKRAVLIKSAENLGPTGGANLGIEYALRRNQPAGYVFLLDNDAAVENDTLTELVALDRKEDVGIVGGVTYSKQTGQIEFAERTTLLRWFLRPLVKADLPLPGRGIDYWPSAGVSGPVMLLRRDVLDAVHASRGRYLADELFMDGWEFEFCQRSSLLGYRSLVTRSAFVWHRGERSSERRGSPKRYYYLSRNRIELARAFLPVRWRILFYICDLLLNSGRILKAFRQGRPAFAGAIVRGMIDGYKGRKGKWKLHDEREGVQNTLYPAVS